MISCEEVARIVASGEQAEAGLRRRLALRFHLFMCRHCRRYVRQLELIDAAARQRWGPSSGDPAALGRIEQALEFESGSIPTASGAEAEN